MQGMFDLRTSLLRRELTSNPPGFMTDIVAEA